MDDYFENSSYIRLADRIQMSKKIIEKLIADGESLQPIIPVNKKTLAKTFLGKKWCQVISEYEDYEFRLKLGRNFFRAHAVLDFKVKNTEIEGRVFGPEIYKVKVSFKPITSDMWKIFVEKVGGKIDSLHSLLIGKISDDIKKLIVDDVYGLFPKENEIKFSCACLDNANLCSHVAAILYASAVYFDDNEEVFFKLRQVDSKMLLSDVLETISDSNDKVNEPSDLEDLFDIQLDEDNLAK